ncbi:hypothetical protein PMI16_04971 [Herbaspirillum sp. CF444]|uniref:FAD/NAD(P)-binding protein n=1 Tax=Herbaspirillum sp. CF444 TaxID=1144319 RepID=UPI0002725E2F|nr:FAD/NAD(P)-binding protein [Herbaspirillum sp. CF444]EJL80896.1 hypothetical protein PMI16_04971 [Herbaspirillum sp. CF444]
MSRIETVPRSVAIIGGGMSGTLAAIRLIRQARTPLLIRLFDPNPELGRGVAYGTTDFSHRLNGPAKAFSLRPDDANHFADWLQARANRSGWRDFDDGLLAFAPRWLYGDYIRAELTEALNVAAPGVELEHVLARVDDIVQEHNRVRIKVDAHREFLADHVLLAPGVFKARPGFAVAQALHDDGRYLADPWNPEALDKLKNVEDVLLVGSSLTMIDAVVSLEARGYRGNYQVVSRRGLVPVGRSETQAWPEFLTDVAAPVSARAVLRAVRVQIARAKAAGEDWQRVVLAVRPHLTRLWQGASLVERQRFMRHVRAYWDMFLHRVPPPSAAVFEAVRASGRLHLHTGTPTAVQSSADGRLDVWVRLRGGSLETTLRSDAVINCTGFEYVWKRVSDQPLPARLLEKGYVRPSALGLGIDADPQTLAVIGIDGKASGNISTMGLPLRGVLFESGTIAELLRQAVLLAPLLDAAGQYVDKEERDAA